MRRIIPFSLYIPPDFKIVMGVLVASMCGLIVLALVASYFQSHNTQPQTKPGKFNLKIDLNSLIFGPTPAKLDDSPSKCMTIKECMDGGEAHQAYVGRYELTTQYSTGEKKVVTQHADLAVEYFRRAQSLGGDPGESLSQAEKDQENSYKIIVSNH